MKNAIYAAAVLLLAALRTTVLEGAEICGASANLLLALTVVIGLCETPVSGAAFGLLCGIFADTLSGGGFGYSSFVFMYAGALSGVLKEYFFRLDAVVVLIFAFTWAFIHDFIYYLFTHLLSGSSGFMHVFFGKILIGACMTAAVAVLIFAVRAWILRMAEKKGNRRRYGF